MFEVHAVQARPYCRHRNLGDNVSKLKHMLASLASVVAAIGLASGARPSDMSVGLPLNYGVASHWVCRPDSGSVCNDDLTTTILLADGTTSVETYRPAEAPRADCFYIYPTVSLSAGLSAGPDVTASEHRAVRQQVERLGSVCRLFAPYYRQITVTSMQPDFPPQTDQARKAAERLAQEDVLAAWDYYMAHYNGGRAVVLVGHSQGAFMIIRLLQQRIDGRPVQRQLVSAIIPGASVSVPTGKQFGGTFRTIPPCQSETQTGCIIAFNSVRADRALPADMREGHPGQHTVCTNPAALSGGAGSLKPYLSTAGESIIPSLTGNQGPWARDGQAISTPFITEPGLFSAECHADEHGAFLEISITRRPNDVRTGNLAGDWMVNGIPEPTMGLHLIDLNLAAGNLVDVLHRQIATMEGAKIAHH